MYVMGLWDGSRRCRIICGIIVVCLWYDYSMIVVYNVQIDFDLNVNFEQFIFLFIYIFVLILFKIKLNIKSVSNRKKEL